MTADERRRTSVQEPPPSVISWTTTRGRRKLPGSCWKDRLPNGPASSAARSLSSSSRCCKGPVGFPVTGLRRCWRDWLPPKGWRSGRPKGGAARRCGAAGNAGGMNEGEEVEKNVRARGSAPAPASTLPGFGSLRRSFMVGRLCAQRTHVDSGASPPGCTRNAVNGEHGEELRRWPGVPGSGCEPQGGSRGSRGSRPRVHGRRASLSPGT